MLIETMRPKVSEPLRSARPLVVQSNRLSGRLLLDRLAHRVVMLGGVTVVASILAIFFVIASEVYPLFEKPTATLEATIPITSTSSAFAMGVDEYREVAFVVSENGFRFVSVRDGSPVEARLPAERNSQKISGVSTLGRGPFAIGQVNGFVLPAEVRFNVTYPDGERKIEPEVVLGDPIQISATGQPVQTLAHVVTPVGSITAALVGPKQVAIATVTIRKALVGKGKKAFALVTEKPPSRSIIEKFVRQSVVRGLHAT